MSPHSKNIGAVILAAGGSCRFGQPKQLILFHGETLLRRVINAVRDAHCSPIVVVIASDDEKVARELRPASVAMVENKQWQRGIGSSIRAGVQALTRKPLDIDAIVLLVCDQPAVDAHAIKRLITLRSTTNKDIVASKYADTLGVPALFSSAFFRELGSLEDGAGAKSIIQQNRNRVAEFLFPGGEIDIDTREEWEKLNGGWASPKTMAKAIADQV